jgi:hypothetical protein
MNKQSAALGGQTVSGAGKGMVVSVSLTLNRKYSNTQLFYDYYLRELYSCRNLTYVKLCINA